MSNFFIEIKSNFHPNWKISNVWSSGNGYKTREEAELWLHRAKMHQMSCSQSTVFSFRIAKSDEVAA